MCVTWCACFLSNIILEYTSDPAALVYHVGNTAQQWAVRDSANRASLMGMRRENLGGSPQLDPAVGAATPAVLAVAPLPGRTVVFQGALLHRATHPASVAGVAVAGQPAGQRYSTVMQLVCFKGHAPVEARAQ